MPAAAMLALIASLAACDSAAPVPEPDKPDLGLLTTLPIYWNETAELGEMLSDQGEPPWPRPVLEQHFDIVPLDTLAGENGVASVDTLLLAQPRALSAEENVALDEWVRAGGHVLLFADPMLTAHSRFHVGDRRRPQDVVLLSPILARWGLELTFDAGQEEGERMVQAGEIAIPTNLSGRFELADADVRCTLEGDGLVARCTIGEGRATIIADAALFEHHEGDSVTARESVLSSLTAPLAQSSKQNGD